ncbi:MAG: MBL fold metallo-hydrolase [Calothrix sp. MO_192.B10]|nr:MBL fold metallo-hydrolase [Calothrix sp. MO_192.B10]
MYLTYLDSNSWLIEIGSKKILLDPWLVGPLTFANSDWFFKGSRPQERPIPENVDLILLSQGLEDHAHPPTLKKLDRSIPVVASANAAKVVKELGYTQVTTLAHGETFSWDESVEITATPGSPIGPTLVENGYLLKELATGFTLYYEPHGYHSPSLKEFAPVDVIITPLIDLALPLLGPFIRGREKALEVAQLLQPQVMLSTAAGGDVIFEGLLVSLLKAVGSIEEFRALLKEKNISTQVMEPQSWQRFEVPLEKRALVI